jgi:hypothetical protein
MPQPDPLRAALVLVLVLVLVPVLVPVPVPVLIPVPEAGLFHLPLLGLLHLEVHPQELHDYRRRTTGPQQNKAAREAIGWRGGPLAHHGADTARQYHY